MTCKFEVGQRWRTRNGESMVEITRIGDLNCFFPYIRKNTLTV